jgi:hypothetical protein
LLLLESSRGFRYKMKVTRQLGILLAFGLACPFLAAQTQAGAPDVWVQMRGGRLAYTVDADGNRIPDFSTAGYEEGESAPPDVPVRATLGPSASGDDTGRIQAAIDALGGLPLDAGGFRGALLLLPGVYRIAGTLELNASGVVLRGSGEDLRGTVLVAWGNPRALLRVGGSGEWQPAGGRLSIVDKIVPVGATSVTVDAGDQTLHSGDRVIVEWNMTKSFIHRIAMDRIPARRDGREVRQWTSAAMGLRFDRRIVRVTPTPAGLLLRLNAPLTQEMHREDDAQVWRYDFPGRPDHIGVENLRSDGLAFTGAPGYNRPGAPGRNDGSFFDSIFAEFETVENAWMRRVTAAHYDNIAVVDLHGRAITLRDVTGEHIDTPEHGSGSAPFAFDIDGQQVLVERCNIASGTLNHVWSTQARVAGPVVFRDSTAVGGRLDAGPHHRWATGVLYEDLRLKGTFDAYNQWGLGTGHGWAGAYNVFWNVQADNFLLESPPGAYNWAVGIQGRRLPPQPGSDPAFYQSYDRPVEPRSLYLEQLRERLARRAGKVP